MIAARRWTASGFFLYAECVVEFIEETAERDAQGQLDQLGLAEMRFKSGEQRVGDAARPLPRGNRVFDGKLVPLVEFWVVAVIEYPFDAGARDTLDNEERGVVRHAIITLVELGDGDNRQFEHAFRQCRGLAQFEQHGHQMAQCRRHMREHR